MKRNGYDLLLEWVYGQTGHFYTQLFELMARADTENLNKLGQGFPEEVEAFRIYAYDVDGLEKIMQRASHDHPLLTKFIQEYSLHRLKLKFDYSLRDQ